MHTISQGCCSKGNYPFLICFKKHVFIISMINDLIINIGTGVIGLQFFVMHISGVTRESDFELLCFPVLLSQNTMKRKS